MATAREKCSTACKDSLQIPAEIMRELAFERMVKRGLAK